MSVNSYFAFISDPQTRLWVKVFETDSLNIFKVKYTDFKSYVVWDGELIIYFFWIFHLFQIWLAIKLNII